MERLEAKVPEFELVPGDVVLYTWQGGGGYGDPLDRDERLVQRDVELGIISEQRAREVYGLGGDRRALRGARLPEGVAESAARSGEPVGRVGVALVLARADGRLQIECACGHALGPADGDWRAGCARRALADSELPRGIVVHSALQLVQYLCPGCGRQHGVEVAERDAPCYEDLRAGPSAMSGRLSGMAALVTGAGRGLGSALALGLAREGANVAVHYNRSRAGAERVAAQIERPRT